MSEEKRVDLYKATEEQLQFAATRPTVWEERWAKGDGCVGIPLQEWFNARLDAARTRGGREAEDRVSACPGQQIMRIRDNIAGVFGATSAEVISTHRSKSVELPVYRLTNDRLKVRAYLRDNFYNIKLSIDSERPVNADFTGLFETAHTHEHDDYSGDDLASCYFEGFPESLVFDYYGHTDGRRWSAQLRGYESLWTALFLIRRSFGDIHRIESNGDVDHTREMDRDTALRLIRERKTK
jgi:hypothetical protein